MRVLLLMVALLLPHFVLAADPAGTQVGRLESVVAQLKGSTVDTAVPEDLQLLLRVADGFRDRFPIEFSNYVVDADNPTNQERAGFVLMTLTSYAKDVIGAAAETRKQKEIVTDQIEQARVNAEADLD
jgi:hypothetical protein